jgi:hypothetical protein
MSKKVLQVIENAYRCTVEEQDDPTVWLTHVMKGAGADLALLLRGNAVNYAVKGQEASGLSFGGRAHAHPPTIDQDVGKLIGKGVPVFVVAEDATDRGIERGELIDGIELTPRAQLGKLFGGFDQIWHW